LRAVVGRRAVEVLLDVERLGVERAFAAAAYLVVNVRRRLGHVERAPDAHRRTVQVARPDFRYVARTVHFLVLLPVLVVVVRLQRKLRTAHHTLEASAVEEREVFEWAHPVHLVHRLIASQARALVKVRPVHRAAARAPAILQSGRRQRGGACYII